MGIMKIAKMKKRMIEIRGAFEDLSDSQRDDLLCSTLASAENKSFDAIQHINKYKEKFCKK